MAWAPSPPPRIVLLADRTDLLHLVAAWCHAEWGHAVPGRTLAQREARLRAGFDPRRLPIVFVAVDGDGRALGTATLMNDDLDDDKRNPWLASVYVAPEFRRRGIAAQLVGAVEAAARRLGFARIFLYTPSAAPLYARLGWRALETRPHRGEIVTVMDRDLAAA